MANGYCWARTALFIIPKWCLCVCSYIWGLSQKLLCLSACSDVCLSVREKERDRGREREQWGECLCKSVCRVNSHVCVWYSGLSSSCVFSPSVLMIFIPHGSDEDINSSLIKCLCLFAFVNVSVWVCIYNIGTVMWRGAAYWLMKLKRGPLCWQAEPHSNNKSFT